MAQQLTTILNLIFDLSPLQIIFAILIVALTPIFLHTFVFRASGLTTLPSILLIGPSGAGKTSLLTLMERGQYATTHTSQASLAVECDLPVGTTAGSDKYRSINDPTNLAHKKFFLIDSPGHGKLRNFAREEITKPQNLKGIIFVVDAASLSVGDEGLRQAAEYLHDTLLLLQKRTALAKTSKIPKDFPVLVAANKMDLFTALPAALVNTTLESEITKIRNSKSRGLLDSGIGMDGEADSEEEVDWLGEMGSEAFKFTQLEEFSIAVEVLGGNVAGGDESHVEKWWGWIADQL